MMPGTRAPETAARTTRPNRGNVRSRSYVRSHNCRRSHLLVLCPDHSPSTSVPHARAEAANPDSTVDENTESDTTVPLTSPPPSYPPLTTYSSPSHVDDSTETKKEDPGAGEGDDAEETKDEEKGDEEEGWGKFCT